jgi:FkbM family methyltransferase
MSPDFSKGLAIDVGANVGTHSTYFATKFGEVLAFEPQPRIRKLLEWNCEPYSNVTVLPQALSDQKGSGRIQLSDPNNLGGAQVNAFTPNKEFLADHDARVIELVTLDSRVKSNQRVALIKIDVEGSELKVIKGAIQTIARDHPVIMFEQNADISRGLSNEIFGLLNKFQYSYEWIAPMNSKAKSPVRQFQDVYRSLLFSSRPKVQTGQPPIGQRIPLVLALPNWAVS